jgi:predicted membrane protein
MIGSVLAIVLMLAYIGAFQGSLKGSAQLLVAIGSVAIILTYLEVASQRRIVALHIAMSAALIVGFLLVTVGILEATGSPVVGLLGVLFGFLWMNTRISLSNWRHALLCGKCPEACKSY